MNNEILKHGRKMKDSERQACLSDRPTAECKHWNKHDYNALHRAQEKNPYRKITALPV